MEMETGTSGHREREVASSKAPSRIIYLIINIIISGISSIVKFCGRSECFCHSLQPLARICLPHGCCSRLMFSCASWILQDSEAIMTIKLEITSQRLSLLHKTTNGDKSHNCKTCKISPSSKLTKRFTSPESGSPPPPPPPPLWEASQQSSGALAVQLEIHLCQQMYHWIKSDCVASKNNNSSLQQTILLLQASSSDFFKFFKSSSSS